MAHHSPVVITNRHNEEVRTYASRHHVVLSINTLTGYDTLDLTPDDALLLASAIARAAVDATKD